MTPAFTLRPATDADRPALLRFVYELNVFEAAFEPNRRTDDGFAAPTLDWALTRVRDGNGAIVVAVAAEGEAIGWVAAHGERYPPYVRSDRATFGYIAELYVVASWRGRGVGRGLIEAAKAHFRNQGLAHVMIGSHSGNAIARAAYDALGFRAAAIEYLMDLE